MKKLLIITNYFPPEIGAASNRIFHLAEGLHKEGYDVSVLTPMPNYPTGMVFKAYRGKWISRSNEKGISIIRLWILASNSKNKLIRLFAMLSYSFSLVWFFMWNKIPNTVIVQSPPLLVAFTGMLFLKRKRRRLILNVSDLWPIAGLELGALKQNFSYRILESIEKFNYKRASLILGQSDEILTHISKEIPEKTQLFLYRNFPNFNVDNAPYVYEEGRLKIVYAGLLGFAQGILKLIQELNYQNIEFHIYGSGAEKEPIEALIRNNPELPITFHGNVTREELHKALPQYDLTIIPLLNRIYGSVPSKIFEYAKLGLPMLYFGGGEGEEIVSKYKLGWVAEAGNYDSLNDVITSIDKNELTQGFRNHIRSLAQKEFDFDLQLKQLKEKL